MLDKSLYASMFYSVSTDSVKKCVYVCVCVQQCLTCATMHVSSE